ncbi:MAG: hypothetical protein K2L14_05510 [Duncaniella sp.]|nr:hypothetical protein [Duncaniella sp.]
MSCGAAMLFEPPIRHRSSAAPDEVCIRSALHGLAPVVIHNLVPSALIQPPQLITIRRRGRAPFFV